MVMAAPCSRDSMLTSGTARDCCAGTSGRGAFGCARTPGSTVEVSGGATNFISFTCPWGTGVAVNGAVSGSNPCGPGVSETIVLRFTLGLI